MRIQLVYNEYIRNSTPPGRSGGGEHLLSGALVGFGLWIRLKLEETPVFRKIEERGERPSAPISEVFRTERRALAAAVLIRVCPDVLYATSCMRCSPSSSSLTSARTLICREARGSPR